MRKNKKNKAWNKLQAVSHWSKVQEMWNARNAPLTTNVEIYNIQTGVDAVLRVPQKGGTVSEITLMAYISWEKINLVPLERTEKPHWNWL